MQLAAWTICSSCCEPHLAKVACPRCTGTPAKAGYPSIVVPGGFFDNVVNPPFPADFNAQPGPAGVTFSGRAFSEPRLIALAYAFEQATHYRIPPPSVPPLASDHVVK